MKSGAIIVLAIAGLAVAMLGVIVFVGFLTLD